MKEKLTRVEVLFKLGLLAFFGFLYFLSSSYPAKSRQFPQLIAIFVLIMLLISLIIDLTQKGSQRREIGEVDDIEARVIDKETKKKRKKRFYLAWGIILFSVAVGFIGGFLFTTFSLFICFAIFFGQRKNLIKNSALAIGITIAVFVLFEWVMKVPLIGGILW